jgi:acyl-CoA thioester hydrolase
VTGPNTLPPQHLAESPLFRLEIVASPDEVDELNHVSNLVYLRWVLRVAQAHSSAVGYDYPAYEELGAVFVVRRHEIDYLAPAFAGDRITLTTWIERWRGASSVRRSSITRAVDGVELARASTLWAFVSMDSGRPTRIPADLVERFRQPP